MTGTLAPTAELHATARATHLFGLLADNDREGSRAVAEGILAGDEGPDDLALPGALAALAWLAWDEGRVVDTLGFLRAAGHRASRSPLDPGHHLYARFGRARVLAAIGDLAAASSAVAEDAWEIERTGDRGWAGAPEVLRAVIELAAGRPAAARACAEAGLDLSSDQPAARMVAGPALATCAVAALSRGDLAEARRMVDAIHRSPAAGKSVAGIFGVSTYVWIEARVAEAECGSERAVHLLREVYGDPNGHRRLFVEEPAAAAWLVRAARSVGWATGEVVHRRQSEAVVACVEQLAAENRGVGSVVAAAQHARGVLDGDVQSLAGAAQGHLQPWARASAYEDLGAALLVAGEPADSRRFLERALEGFIGAGAPRDAIRVRNRLGRLVSQSHGRRPQLARPLTGWGSLTETERRVAFVVAEGLTNAAAGERLYLSRHTVDFHLRQIFRKLGIRSRVELTRLALEHPPTSSTAGLLAARGAAR
jgi:DNA-binding CsgD family transcriptional regulator